MGNQYFQFKEFRIAQDQCAMKVGTDGVLLGAWAELMSAQRILDIGTGTGLIALMCAQRAPNGLITAIEIDERSAIQASSNVKESKFSGQIDVIRTGLQDFQANEHFDSIICNPPFFPIGTPSPKHERNVARQALNLSLDELVAYSVKLLREEGELSVVIPVDRVAEMNGVCAKSGLYLKRICVVYPAEGKASKRTLLAYARKETKTEETELTIETNQRHVYSKEYVDLTRPFYSKM